MEKLKYHTHRVQTLCYDTISLCGSHSILQHGEGAESSDVLNEKRFEDVITEKGSSTECRLKGLNTNVKVMIQFFLFNKIPIMYLKTNVLFLN